MFRDEAMDQAKPVAMACKGPSGHQAIAFSVLPDFRKTKVKVNVKQAKKGKKS
jgi:hypothetical protein